MAARMECLEERRLLAFELGNVVALSGDTVQVLDMGTDRQGNVYVAGRFEGLVDFDTRRNHSFELVSAGRASSATTFRGDAFVAKYTADGRLRWARQLSVAGEGGDDAGEVGAMAVASNGDVYLSGNFDGAVDFNPFRRDFVLESEDSDAFVWKLNSDGVLRWATIVPSQRGTPIESHANALAIDAFGDVVVSGETLSAGDEGSGLWTVARLIGATGEIAYNKEFLTLDAVRATAAGANSDGHVVIAGIQDPITGRNTFVAKINRRGNVVWYEGIGGAVATTAENGVAVSRRGAVFVAGSFTGTGVFGSTVRNAGGSDAFLARLDTDGDVDWARTWGGTGDDFADDVTLDRDEDVIVGGRFSGVVDLNPGGGTAEFDSGNTPDGSIARFRQSGAFVHVSTIGGKHGFPTTGMRVAANGRGEVFAGTSYVNAIDVDPGEGLLPIDAGDDEAGFWVRYIDD